MGTRPDPSQFSRDYDLDSLQSIHPRGHTFAMWVTPRFLYHYVGRSYERLTARLIANVMAADGLFVDVGAHYGFFSLLVASRYPGATVLALEPQPENFAILRRNVERNRLDGIQCLGVAASDDAGETQLFVSQASDNCSFYPHQAAPPLRSIPVEIAPLDRLLAGFEPRPLVVKIDTEGHELAVLAGMKESLRRFPDLRLFVEWNPKMLRQAGHRPEELPEALTEAGFACHLIDDEEGRIGRLGAAAAWVGRLPPEGAANLYCTRAERAVSVCLFSHSSGLAGAERSLLELVTELIQDHGVAATVVLPEEGPLRARLEEVGSAAIVFPYGWWCGKGEIDEAAARARMARDTLEILDRLVPELSRLDPDVILTMTMVMPWGAFAAQALGKPHVWHVCEWGERDHGLRFAVPFERILETIRDTSNLVFTPGQALRAGLFPELSEEGCVVLYRHVEVPMASGATPPGEGLSGDGALRLGVFATLQEGKGQETAVSAVAELQRRGRRVELVLAGGAVGEYQRHLEEVIEGLGVGSNVTILGFVEDVYREMARIDVVVVPSTIEAFGRVAVEAMLLGKPVIYSRAGEVEIYMEDGVTGLAFPVGDASALADRVELLIAEPGLARGLAERGREFARSTFTREAFGGLAYRRLLGLRGSAPPQLPILPALVGGWLRTVAAERDGLSSRTAVLAAELARSQEESAAARGEWTEARGALVATRGELASALEELATAREELAALRREREALVEERGSALEGAHASLEGRLDGEAERADGAESRERRLREELKLLAGSLSWRLVGGWWRWADRLLPGGSRRRRGWNRAIDALARRRHRPQV